MASFWIKEIMGGLVNEIHNSSFVLDERGEHTPVHNIIVKKPEEDFKEESFPCVSISYLEIKFDHQRYDGKPILVSRNGNSLTLEEPSKSYVMDVQIDFWARYQEDIDTMTRTWLDKHFRDFNLPIVDNNQEERLAECLIVGGVKSSDLVLNGKRLFRSIQRLKIWIELDEQQRYDAPMVTDTFIQVQLQKGGK